MGIVFTEQYTEDPRHMAETVLEANLSHTGEVYSGYFRLYPVSDV